MLIQQTILVAQPRDDDFLLLKVALKKSETAASLFRVRNGEETIAYLSGAGRFSIREEFPLPDLLILDLNLPSVGGFEVLELIRRQPGLAQLPVVALTSSYGQDAARAYGLGATTVLSKPRDFDECVKTCRFIEAYWLSSPNLQER